MKCKKQSRRRVVWVTEHLCSEALGGQWYPCGKPWNLSSFLKPRKADCPHGVKARIARYERVESPERKRGKAGTHSKDFDWFVGKTNLSNPRPARGSS